MPNFAQRVEVAVDALSTNPPKDVDENEFIDASRLVYDGVREIRRAVLMNRVSCVTNLYWDARKKLLIYGRYENCLFIKIAQNVFKQIIWEDSYLYGNWPHTKESW